MSRRDERLIPYSTNQKMSSSHDDDEDEATYRHLPNDFSVLAVTTATRLKAQPRDHQVESLLAKKANFDKPASSKNQGRDDRATTEQVMDPRTRLILFKMLDRGLFEEIHGCVSTGKEANVYHATSSSKSEFAVKVFKTSILVFRDRDKYVSGDHRFKSGYGRGNPRKMVKMWAEKELKNLNRLHASGLACPEPKILKDNVLVMEFIGQDGWPAPRLRDANLDDDKFRACYLQTVRAMRIMFHKCRLVHGDLSEYNMLYFKKQVYIIDVSQSVELDHPRALDFLRMDCINVTNFFVKAGKVTNALSAKKLFDFVVDASFGCEDDAEMDRALDVLLQQQQDQETGELDEEQVFMQSHIPRSLAEVDDYERVAASVTMNHARSGGGAGATATMDAVADMTLASKRKEEEEEETSSEEEDDDDDDEWTTEKPSKPVDGIYRVKTTTPEERKAHKAAVRQAKAEKRKSKVKKADKKLHRYPVAKA
jgi:RIO kinase 1